jgi:flavin-dependent dehydrogenase
VRHDVLVVGGGPAGLATAIECARRGLRSVVVERSPEPPDKACGEGLMPAGVRSLERLGALAHLDRSATREFLGIRYVQEDGASVAARFRDGPGLGVRRTALVAALTARALEVGVLVRHGEAVLEHERGRDGVRVRTSATELEGRVLVAADGLASELRRSAGLDGRGEARRRFGVRRHFRVAPWSPWVEVHWGESVEAYVTPVGPERVGVAFLWDRDRRGEKVSFEHFLKEFPALEAKVAGAPFESQARGAGPLERRARSRVAHRLALVGDAAGYVDAITGEGLTLSFACARGLARVLPRALERGCTASALAPYERAFHAAFLPYAVFTRAVLLLSERAWLRRRLLHGLSRAPRVFEELLQVGARAVERT